MLLLSLLLFLVHGSLLINHSHVSSCGRATIVRYAWQRTHLFASWLSTLLHLRALFWTQFL